MMACVWLDQKLPSEGCVVVYRKRRRQGLRDKRAGRYFTMAALVAALVERASRRISPYMRKISSTLINGRRRGWGGIGDRVRCGGIADRARWGGIGDRARWGGGGIGDRVRWGGIGDRMRWGGGGEV